MNNTTKLVEIRGVIQHYHWGGKSFLPALLKLPNPGEKPFAEYWLGAHENAPSLALDSGKPLTELIRNNPVEILGSEVNNRFHRLPFLLKVLDVRDMLSIQTHPSKKAAERGFEEENEKGIPLDSPERNFKDDNHKPELMLALSEFWLLHGFKAKETINALIHKIHEFEFLAASFEQSGYLGLYQTIMEMPQEAVNEKLEPLLRRILPAYKKNQYTKDQAEFWASRAALTYNEPGRCDRGIFSVFLLNLVHLQPGEAIFQAAGIPHAYLEGQNMEIMANSDNVLRGGLTNKYIDVTELLKHIRYEETIPEIIHGREEGFIRYFDSPAEDFLLSAISIPASNEIKIRSASPEIFLLLEGAADVLVEDNTISLKKGHSFLASFGTELVLAATEHTLIYRASVPSNAST